MASAGPISSHHTSKENTGVSKTEEHVERLLMLLCGASAQAGSEEVVIGLSDGRRASSMLIAHDNHTPTRRHTHPRTGVVGDSRM
jgi:hypothetical protein